MPILAVAFRVFGGLDFSDAQGEDLSIEDVARLNFLKTTDGEQVVWKKDM